MTNSTDRFKRAEEQNVDNTELPVGSGGDAPNQSWRLSRIRELNDELRISGRGGMVMLSNGVSAFSLETVNAIFVALGLFNNFDSDNDPWGEHDCAALTVNDIRLIWKIDYYDRSRRIHSPDPADPKVTVRVLTVLLADEY